MIFSSNQDHNIPLFDKILNDSIMILNDKAKIHPEEMKGLAGTILEKYVANIMSTQSVGTEFENTIECLGGISFPDIIANNYFGVEVKTTIKDHWKTTGNSVLESTRRQGIEKIYMLFGKLGGRIEFRYRPYEECLSEVVVTHSPRYLIDMNLRAEHTIFDKIDISYDELRRKDNPIRPIVDYYKKGLKPGEELWWIDPSHAEPVSLVIKLWSNLNQAQKNEYIIKGLTYFPELLGKSASKFNRFAIWLTKSQGIVCTNIRDNFTAGGRVTLNVNNKIYKNVPRIFDKIRDRKSEIKDLIKNSDPIELMSFSSVLSSETEPLNKWIEIATSYSKEILEPVHHGLIPNIFSADR